MHRQVKWLAKHHTAQMGPDSNPVLFLDFQGQVELGDSQEKWLMLHLAHSPQRMSCNEKRKGKFDSPNSLLCHRSAVTVWGDCDSQVFGDPPGLLWGAHESRRNLSKGPQEGQLIPDLGHSWESYSLKNRGSRLHKSAKREPYQKWISSATYRHRTNIMSCLFSARSPHI